MKEAMIDCQFPKFVYEAAKRAYEGDIASETTHGSLIFSYSMNEGIRDNDPALPKAILDEIRVIVAWVILDTGSGSFQIKVCIDKEKGRGKCKKLQYPHVHLYFISPKDR